ncbi:MAG TPA: serine/threonine-protein kinase, partial [Rhodothermales bacterium]|nr:serine/threonine-protein kinase [Rhodothermales bacterium]
MDAHRWSRVNELFDAAYEVVPEERKAYLEKAVAGDEALFREVWSLLHEDQHTHSLLDGVALDAITVLDDTSHEGRRIGPYQIEREIGHGGMGRVFLAHRADGEFEQQVALKLIKRGMDSEAVLHRFRSERQILARLQHPHIARLLDGGLTDEGQPYFAMEYVEGQPIDVFCDAHHLTIDERLALFQDVCRAVLYAHAQLVVHRDLKPSNILVMEDASGRPQVKLLDFGIAKMLAEDEEGLTQTGVAVMTPEYASPEQVRGEAVSTATDIYSLGVVLYELLAGHRPYDIASRNSVEMAQVVLSTEPERPSTAVKRPTGDTTAEAISRARGTVVERLRRRLAGDLDVICLKALRKEVERRYQSVEALAEDLRRHLSGLPVEARADTATYRVRKFVERHRAGVFTTAGMLLLVSALVGFYTVQ